MIHLWYGNHQIFGARGRPQAWINVLGHIEKPSETHSLSYRIDDGSAHPLSIGPDSHRLARPGDFNVEIAYKDLTPGLHTLTLTRTGNNGTRLARRMTLDIREPAPVPAELEIDFSTLEHLTDAAQVVDGRWRLTPDGIRVDGPYYDRILAFGDLSWRDVHVRADVIFHGVRVPDPNLDGGADVIHAGIALRWPGHDDDEFRPRRKWYPLGAGAEFRLSPDIQRCGWRILGGEGVSVKPECFAPVSLEKPFRMEHRVQTLPDGSNLYQARLREVGIPANSWDIALQKAPGSQSHGGVLLLAHYTDLTFMRLHITTSPSDGSASAASLF